MGWRWRKTFGRGPVRISMSRKGMGWSVGIPGLRFGRAPDGRTYMSQGIPGTGLYRIKFFPAAKKPSSGGTPHPTPPAPTGAPTPRPQNLPTTPMPQPATTGTAAPGPLVRMARAITRFFDRLF